MRRIILSEEEYQAVERVLDCLISSTSYLGEKYRENGYSHRHHFFFGNAWRKLKSAPKETRKELTP